MTNKTKTTKQPETTKAQPAYATHPITITFTDGNVCNNGLNAGRNNIDAPLEKPLRSPTARDSVLLGSLKAAYGKKPFSTMGLDSEIIKQAIGNGFVKYDSNNQTISFTASGSAFNFLNDGVKSRYSVAISNKTLF